MNTVTISGNLTRDPELKYSKSNKAVCKMSIAVNERRRDLDEDEVHFFDVVCFGGWAETAGNTLRKGSRVIVSGKLQQGRWQAQDGSQRSSVGIMAFEVYGAAERDSKPSGAKPTAFAAAPVGQPDYDDDSSVPF